MKHLVHKQLAQSIATLQAVLADEKISDTLVTIAELTAHAMQSGHKLLVAGNGGSAADAQHLVAEFVVRLTVDRPALRAIALTTDTSILTAAGNDYGFDTIFARQIEALGQPGDIFLGISTSGNSKNILNAFQQAKKRHHHHRLQRQRRRPDAHPLRPQHHHPLNRHHEHPGVPPRPRTHLLHDRRALHLRPRLRHQTPDPQRIALSGYFLLSSFAAGGQRPSAVEVAVALARHSERSEESPHFVFAVVVALAVISIQFSFSRALCILSAVPQTSMPTQTPSRSRFNLGSRPTEGRAY